MLNDFFLLFMAKKIILFVFSKSWDYLYIKTTDNGQRSYVSKKSHIKTMDNGLMSSSLKVFQ